MQCLGHFECFGFCANQGIIKTVAKQFCDDVGIFFKNIIGQLQLKYNTSAVIHRPINLGKIYFTGNLLKNTVLICCWGNCGWDWMFYVNQYLLQTIEIYVNKGE